MTFFLFLPDAQRIRSKKGLVTPKRQAIVFRSIIERERERARDCLIWAFRSQLKRHNSPLSPLLLFVVIVIYKKKILTTLSGSQPAHSSPHSPPSTTPPFLPS